MDLQAIELGDLTPAQLDSFLSFGWFRIQQTIFTTDKLVFDGVAYQPVWLRVLLNNLKEGKRYKTLKKKNCKFRTEIRKAEITFVHEQLFNDYRESVPFETAPGLHWLLYGNSYNNVYDTYMINMYDGEKLIAAGYFDLGKTSAAGISVFYGRAYKNFSPGVFMIFEKMFYCQNKGYEFFYPGYFVPGYPLFDYKLEIGQGAQEYFDASTKEWMAMG